MLSRKKGAKTNKRRRKRGQKSKIFIEKGGKIVYNIIIVI